MSQKFVKPPERNPSSILQPEYYRRELRSFEAIHLNYGMNSDGKRESEHWMNKTDYPEQTHTTVTRVTRVLLKPGQFELEDGTIAPADQTPKRSIGLFTIRIHR